MPVVAPKILRNIAQAITLKLGVKERKLKIDALNYAINRATVVPYGIEHPGVNFDEQVNRHLHIPAKRNPPFYLMSELTHQRAQHSKECALALSEAGKTARSFNPLTLATNAKASAFLLKVDTQMNALCTREARALVESFADRYMTMKRISEQFDEFLNEITDEKRATMLDDDEYDMAIADDAFLFPINRPSQPPCKKTKIVDRPAPAANIERVDKPDDVNVPVPQTSIIANIDIPVGLIGDEDAMTIKQILMSVRESQNDAPGA